jgi:hypothetical protein
VYRFRIGKDLKTMINISNALAGRMQPKEKGPRIRYEGKMVHVGFKIYRCNICGHEEKARGFQVIENIPIVLLTMKPLLLSQE